VALRHRIVVGSLRWDNEELLTDTGLRVMYTSFVAVVFGRHYHYKNEDLDANIMIEGEPKPEVRKLGSVDVGQTSILALQGSITHLQKHPKQVKRTPGRLSITLGIGSPLFGVASMGFWAMSLPDELKANAKGIIDEFETFEDGEVAWLDSYHPHALFRNNMHDLNEELLRKLSSE
jgi:hypothetical protein